MCHNDKEMSESETEGCVERKKKMRNEKERLEAKRGTVIDEEVENNIKLLLLHIKRE